MSVARDNLEETLGAILRGAAKILGCNSTNLILINEKTRRMGVRIGTMANSYPVLANIESLLGDSFKGISFPLESASDGLVYRSWKDLVILETSSLTELVGSAIDRSVMQQVASLIGEHRFICIPALSGTRKYGVLLFEKNGKHPFSSQQREVLLQYARSIGEIIENDVVRQGQSLLSQPSEDGTEYLVFDHQGRLVGSGEEESAGRPESLLAAEEVVGVLSQEVLRFVAGREGQLRDLVLPAKGPLPRLQINMDRLRLGEQGAVLCSIRSSQGSSERSLGRQLLQLTLRDPSPALLIDQEMKITSCNEATADLFGYTSDELVERPVTALFRDKEQLESLLGQQALDPVTPYCEETSILVKRDGTLFRGRLKTLLFANDRDRIVGYLLLIRADHDALDDENEEPLLNERLAMMGEMAAQLAHEIRNPLLAIGATLRVLHKGALPLEQREVIASLVKEIDRLDMILKDCLTGKHDMSFGAVHLSEVIDDAKRLLVGEHRAAHKTVRVEIDPDLVVWADYDALKHVFFNLLHNALQASPDQSEVRCTAEVRSSDTSVLIDDRGPGLGASAKQCLRPFFTTKKNGTGLGLAVCQKIAAAHGGVVQLDNRPDGGCRATLTLPHRSGMPARLTSLPQ
jgi:PAS domain S-box-containing protein